MRRYDRDGRRKAPSPRPVRRSRPFLLTLNGWNSEMVEKTTRYRPSSGSESDWFMSRWCELCVKDRPSKPCSIIGRTMALAIDDRKYPPQWVEDDDGPRCTAFADHEAPKPTIIKDKRQIGMQL